jgi:serine/threonine-protein kinase
VPGRPPDPPEDPFDQAGEEPAGPGERAADVTSRILAKHQAMKSRSGGTSRIEKIRAQQAASEPQQAPPRPDVVLAIIVGNGWVAEERAEELRDFFYKKGVTQVLRRNGRVSGLLVERGLLAPHHARELELTLLDQGVFPRFRITRVLGSGMVGRTYVAVDLSTGADVAFKIFRQTDPDLRQAFLDDVAALEKVRSRRVAQAIACGEHDDACFIASSLVRGERLSRLINERRVESEIHAARIALQIAEGLAYVHVTAGLCHRALKPENVLLQQEGARLAVVLTDFAIADQVPPSRGIDPAWRAPECGDGIAPRDARADIFAVGAIFYNLLGAIGGDPAEQRRAEIDLERFRPLTRDIVYTATAPDPGRRYRDHRSFIAVLARLLNELGHVEPDEVPQTPGQPAGEGTMFLRKARDPNQPLLGQPGTARRERRDQDGWRG